MKPRGIAKFETVRFVWEKSEKSIEEKKEGGINGKGKRIQGMTG